MLQACSIVTLAVFGCGPAQVEGEAAGETTAASSTGGSVQDTGETGEDQDCGGFVWEFEVTPAQVMFVVDTSASMLREWDHDGDPNTPTQTRWASARALIEAITASTELPTLWGLQRFPSPDASTCEVGSGPEVELGAESGAALLAALPSARATAVELAGGSPASSAYALALGHAKPNATASPTSIVLLTDGRGNCGAGLEPPDQLGEPDEQLLALVQQAFDQDGVNTVVIAIDEAADPELELGFDGLLGFDPREQLQALGLAGGVPASWETSYYSASDLDPAAIDFNNIVVEPGVCVIDLTQTEAGPPADPDLVEWFIDDVPVPFVQPEDCASVSGWTWIGEPGVVVTMCGPSCDAFRDAERIEAVYACPVTG